MTTLEKTKQDVEDIWRICDGDIREFKRQMAVSLFVWKIAYETPKQNNEVRP